MVTKRYQIIYAPDVSDHLASIERKYYSLIRKSIEDQLLYEPDAKTPNRKPLQFASQYGEWELRFGPDNRFRVIYRFSVTDREVLIGAIGEKKGHRLFVGGQEVTL